MTRAPSRLDTPKAMNALSLHKVIDGIDDYNDKIYAAARWYANNGFHIVPFLKGGYPNGLSQTHATDKEKNITRWWSPKTGLYPGATIAMAHGGASGFCAIDLDVKPSTEKKEAIDGVLSLADLQAAYGSYGDAEGADIQTLMATTPSGGRHLIYRYHPEINSNSESAYAGIDTRGGLKTNSTKNGGITFVEPSRSLKPGVNGVYRWSEDVCEIIDMPQWLVDVLNGRQVEKPSGGMKLQDVYIQSAAGDHGEGRDRNIYMDLMRFVGIGYTEEQLWDLMPDILSRMEPPDELMVKRKIESVINSQAFRKASVEKETKTQISGLKLDRDSKSRPLKSAKNLRTILNWSVFEHEYGYIEYDEFSQKFILNKKPIDSGCKWEVGIQIWISTKLDLEFPLQTLYDAIMYEAYAQRPRANIAREYMFACPRPMESGVEDYWGSGRKGPGGSFNRLCTEVLDLDNDALHAGYNEEVRKAYKSFLWFWMQGVVARACVPGCKMEIVLNIFGSQGIGKSLFFRGLCPDPSWFTDSIQDSIAGTGFNIRDELLKLLGKIIVEMPEMSPIKRAGKSGDDKMKQFISAQVDNYRGAYGRDSTDHARSCALCGTSNDLSVYRDATGARRFASIDHGNIAIRVGDKNTGAMGEIRDSMWGEVVDSFQPGELDGDDPGFSVEIPVSLRDLQNKTNVGHTFDEVGVAEVVDWMRDKTRVTWKEIVTFARTVAGFGDAKEVVIMNALRTPLQQVEEFTLKKRLTITNSNGQSERASRAWVNNLLAIERDRMQGDPVPPHWSTYSGDLDQEY